MTPIITAILDVVEVAGTVYNMISSSQAQSAAEHQEKLQGYLSEESMATASTALKNYNAGTLSPAYQGAYQAQYDQQLAQVKQQLASAGYGPGSTQYTSAMEGFNQWAANLKSGYLQQELQSALSAGGMSQQGIQNYLAQQGIDIKQQYIDMIAAKNLGTATAGLSTGLGNMFQNQEQSAFQKEIGGVGSDLYNSPLWNEPGGENAPAGEDLTGIGGFFGG
jgi:hypothetical protein